MRGVPGVKAGAVITGILLGTITVYIIEKQLVKVGVICLVGCLLSAFGFIHSAQLGFQPDSPFAIGYLIVAVLAFLLHLGRNTWFKGPDDFEMYKVHLPGSRCCLGASDASGRPGKPGFSILGQTEGKLCKIQNRVVTDRELIYHNSN